MSVFLLIGLQNDFLSPQGALLDRRVKDVDKLVFSISELLSWIRCTPSTSLIWVQADYLSSNSAQEILRGKLTPEMIQSGTHSGQRSICIPGSFGHCIFESIAAFMQPSDSLISKKWYSAFKETGRWKLSTVIVYISAESLVGTACVRRRWTLWTSVSAM